MKKSKVALGKCNIIMRVLVTNKEDLISFNFLFLFIYLLHLQKDVSGTGLDLNFRNSTLFSFMQNNAHFV